MKYLLLIFLTIAFGPVMSAQHNPGPEYRDGTHVADIVFDPSRDKADFTLCNEHYVRQYYMIGESWNMDRAALKRLFFAQYKALDMQETGFLTIRFVVNCKGEIDRFRIFGTTPDYAVKHFSPLVSDQLLAILKGLPRWSFSRKEITRDFYTYLTFKIEQGQLLDIRP